MRWPPVTRSGTGLELLDDPGGQIQRLVGGHDAAVRRMEWRCRRGMLELDLMFKRFVSQHLPQLNDAQIAALDKLLDLPDNELWSLVSLPEVSQDIETEQVLRMLRGE